MPIEQQRATLAFVESLAQSLVARTNPETAVSGQPFQSVKGILRGDIGRLEDDLREVRGEMWRNFPRQEP